MRVHEDNQSSLKESRSWSEGTIIQQEEQPGEPARRRSLNFSSQLPAARHGRRASERSKRKRSKAKKLA